MIIAQEKRRNNIVEYILYMWQVEDTIRACNFDMNLIEQRIIDQYRQPDSVKEDIRNWYTDLMLMMHEENVKERGHIKLVTYLIDELEELHTSILTRQLDADYLVFYQKAKPNIEAFNDKIAAPLKDIYTCLQALYGLLLMRLQKRAISDATLASMNTFSQLLAALSAVYLKMEQGQMEV